MCNGKYNFNNLCVSLEKSELLEPELAYHFKKGKNPYWNKNYKVIQNNLSSDLNYLFKYIDEKLNVENKNIYTDGFVSVMISLFRMIITYIKSKLVKNRTKAKDILNILINEMNLYTKDNIKTLRTKLSSEAGKKEYTNDIIRIIQNDYDENFSLGFIKKEPSLALTILQIQIKEKIVLKSLKSTIDLHGNLLIF